MNAQDPKQSHEDPLITLHDCLYVLKNKKRTIGLSTLIIGLSLGGYILTKPVEYESEATFKEKNNTTASTGISNIAGFFLSGLNGEGKSEAKTMMASRKIQEDVITTLNLQAKLTNTKNRPSLLKTIRDNLIVEYYSLRKLKRHPLPDTKEILKVKEIEFVGEVPETYRIVFESEDTYQLLDENQQPIGYGKIDAPFRISNGTFTLSKITDEPVSSETFDLSLEPLAAIAEGLSKKIKFVSDNDDPSLFILTYRNRNRLLVPQLLNQLMSSYRDYLYENQHRISSEQISYLNRRRAEMDHRLKEMIDTYARQLSLDASSFGFSDTEKAMEFLALEMQNYRQKLLKLGLELKRQRQIGRNDSSKIFEQFIQSDLTPPAVNELIAEIHRLNLTADGVELALRNTDNNNLEQWNEFFQNQVVELEALQQCDCDTTTLLEHLQQDRLTLPNVDLINNPKYMVKTWIDHFQNYKQQWVEAPLEEKSKKKRELNNFKEQLIAYLENLQHYFNVSQKTIQDKLSHQQGPNKHFQGINLEASEELYVIYCQELSAVESKILQYHFILDELKKPDFELSTLSAMVEDPIINKMVSESSPIALALHDESNRSLREKDRYKKDLEIQKRFFHIHLTQTVELLKLNEKLVKDKIHSLLIAQLELLQQKTSTLQKELGNALVTHIQGIEQEQELIQGMQKQLRSEMAKLPEKWASEQMIEHQLKINTAMVDELIKLVESKNISSNLEIVQSGPIDLAIPSVQPQPPKLLLFTFVGGIFGALLSMVFLLGRATIQGFPRDEDKKLK